MQIYFVCRDCGVVEWFKQFVTEDHPVKIADLTCDDCLDRREDPGKLFDITAEIEGTLESLNSYHRKENSRELYNSAVDLARLMEMVLESEKKD